MMSCFQIRSVYGVGSRQPICLISGAGSWQSSTIFTVIRTNVKLYAFDRGSHNG